MKTIFKTTTADEMLEQIDQWVPPEHQGTVLLRVKKLIRAAKCERADQFTLTDDGHNLSIHINFLTA
jgi:hypothetical protein